MVGCLDLSNPEIESAVVVAARVKRALEHIRPEQVILAPDCGTKYLPCKTAHGKLRAMVEAAQILRQQYS
jgi:5-methyltetrahydropteroyltriglutamate--homocysteine methyltransferase